MKTTTPSTQKPLSNEILGFRVLENECVWMRAGVVNFRLCDRDYDCFDCPFDQSMRRAMEAQSPPKGRAASKGWAEEMRKWYRGTSKPCPYFLSGLIESPKYCNRAYDCDECPVYRALEYQPVSEEIEAERKAQLARIPEVMESPEGKGKAEPHEGSPGLARACVWMKAGVVNFRLCDQEYDCYHCEFDQRMRSAMGESPSSAGTRAGDWASHIHDRHAPAGQPCIHFLTGNPDAPSTCDHGHDCYRCPFHQGLNADAGKDKVEAPTCVVSSGYRLAEGVYYHFGHTWVHLERGGRVRTGMDDFAVKVFGKADSVELPPTGARLTQGEPGWMLIRNGREAAVQAPISGKVIAVNQTIQEDPETAHHDPYGDGWMLMMEPSHLKLELEGLYYGEDRLRWMEAEKQETVRLLGPRYEQLAATGGEPLDDLFGNVSELEWDQLVSTFLRTRKRE